MNSTKLIPCENTTGVEAKVRKKRGRKWGGEKGVDDDDHNDDDDGDDDEEEGEEKETQSCPKLC